MENILREIDVARKKLDLLLDVDASFQEIYEVSTKLDSLIVQYYEYVM